MKKADTIEYVARESAVLLGRELSARVKSMRMRHALWEAGCLLRNDDHGPLGGEYLMPKIPLQRVRVYTGTRESGSYNHHSQLVRFKEKYYLAFSNGFRDEEALGQRVAIVSSSDGLNWSPARTAVAGEEKGGLIQNVVGLHAGPEEMVLYCWSERAVRDATCTGMHRVEAGSNRVDTYTSTDGERWRLATRAIIRPGKSHSMMFEGPRPTREGRLLAGGTQNGPVAYLWPAAHPADKPRVVRIPAPSGEASFPYGEATWYQTEDGTIVMFWRDEGGSERLYVNTSADGGKTWTRPVISDFPDSMSRVYAGRLPDGRYYLAGNSYGKLLDRMHLMLSVSETGYRFDRMYALLEDPTSQRTKGLLKCHGYQYPCCLTDGDRLLIAYSVNKEDIECGIIKTADIP